MLVHSTSEIKIIGFAWSQESAWHMSMDSGRLGLGSEAKNSSSAERTARVRFIPAADNIWAMDFPTPQFAPVRMAILPVRLSFTF